MHFERLTDLLTPGKLEYPCGVDRLPDGILHVGALTQMPGTTPQMFAWWFGEYMQTTEHYQRWHPRDHVWMGWENKQPGTHVGASHLVHEYIGGQLQKLRIHFVPPEEYFGDALESVPGAVAVCARPGMLEHPIDTGRMVHLALPRPWGCELHSHFWLGYIASRDGRALPERLGNRPELRKAAARVSMGRSLLVHCHVEMTTLAGFLPGLHAEETAGREL